MDMKIHNQGVRFSLACVLLILGVAWGSPAWPAPPSDKPGASPPGQAGGAHAPAGDATASSGTTTPSSGNSVSGEAFGVFVQTDVQAGVNSVKVRVPKTPRVVLPPDGGMASDEVLQISIPNTLTSDTLKVITTGAIGESRASAQSSATVEALNILNGLVTADVVVAISSSSGDGSTATSNADGSTIVGLSVNGGFKEDVTPGPNTQIPIPGVGAVILNEQIRSGDGVHSTALTVNMIHVMLNGPVTGDIIVSSAHSDVNFTPAPTPVPATGFMTGGGRLGTGRTIATFGFHAGPTLKGQLEFIDHAKGLKIHSTGINSFSINGVCVTVSGTARVNDLDGVGFTVKHACDNGEPGVGHDKFEISQGDYDSIYLGDVLTGGNLQLH